MISESGVLAPDLSFTVDCDKPPETTYACEKAVARFAKPSDNNSCLGLMVYLCFVASVRAAEMVSIYPMRKHANASSMTPSTSLNFNEGLPNDGNPFGISPVT